MLGKLFVISGPSGSGKTTLSNELVEIFQNINLKRVVTYTTKVPRVNEIDGIDYHFLSKEEFIKKIEQGFFLEYSQSYLAYYGFPNYIVKALKNGQSYIVILDRAGAKSIKHKIEDAILIWLEPKSIEELRKRLMFRAQDSIESINYRLGLAKKEMEMELLEPIFDYKFINDNLDETLLSLQELFNKYLNVYK
ncbi:guanylate kinase [Candidatus Babela massiliensis]|uniref:Guanylate kinase n=1 Tax=Candidatus Babela massiliensis TaxID=673862 RepID=V6DG32_9BACT|nr:guanylate kinase [Candidatus Babela massiliensis]CDK30557.1 Guanylate kinase [Candidatus Babela massiliensis]